MNADKQLNRIFRQAMREAALMQADELSTDLCNSNAVDYHVASTLSHLLPRALPPVQDIIEYTRSIPAPYQKGN
jgi:hypothetical protein